MKKESDVQNEETDDETDIDGMKLEHLKVISSPNAVLKLTYCSGQGKT